MSEQHGVDPEVTFKGTSDKGIYEIVIEERIAGYANLYTDHVVIENADPDNEWDMTVTHKDLGEGLVNPTEEDVLEAVKAWVYDHIDDFEGVEE